MRKLLIYLKPYTLFVILAPTLMLIEVICDLYQPALLAKIVDEGILKTNLPLIFHTGIKMFLIALIGTIGGLGCTVFSSYAGQNFAADLRNDLFKKVQFFSFSTIDKFQTSSLITRLTNDVNQLQTLVTMSLRILVRAPLLFIGGIIMAIVVSKNLSVIFLFSIPSLTFIIFFLTQKGFSLFSQVQKMIDKLNAVVRENLAGIRVVRAFMRINFEKERFKKANEMLMNACIRAFKLMISGGPLFMFVVNVSIVLVLWYGGFLVKTTNMEIGKIIAYINYLSRILFALIMIGNILIFISRASVSAERINEILEQPVEIINEDKGISNKIKKGEIVFENVCFSFNGDFVLKNISFSAKPSEIVAISGPTGSGKSTLINLIARLYKVSSGRILIDGIDINEIEIEELRKKISIVPQEIVLFSGTIKENICFGKEDATEEEIIEAAKIAQAHDFIMSFPEGYETLIGEKGITLSGGQKQRIAIARAIIRKPLILILDDCTSAIDFLTEQKILKELKKIMRNTTTFIITQRITTIMNADKVLILEKGEISGFGTHKELIKNNPFYIEIYNSQLGGIKNV